MPAVSIMLPIYNVEKFLPRCLDSVIDQTFTDIEIICVDDCSPDGSAAILADYAARDPRIRILTHPKNKGTMQARKTAYSNATGTYLMFMDSDDCLASGALQNLYDKAINCHCDITIGQRYLINLSGNRLLRPKTAFTGNDATNYIKGVFSGLSCDVCGSLFKKEIFDGGFIALPHQTYWEDLMLLLQILVTKNPSVACMDQPTYLYYLNTQSVTRVAIDSAKLKKQLDALMWCYDYIAVNAPCYLPDAVRFISHTTGVLIEQGIPSGTITGHHPNLRQWMQFGKLRENVSLKFAIHVTLCRHMPFYRQLAAKGRAIIRKIQGKD